jgi:hypothetical protein
MRIVVAGALGTDEAERRDTSATASTQEKPPGKNPAAREGRDGTSGFEGIGTIPVLVLSGRDSEAKLLTHSSREESPNRVG